MEPNTHQIVSRPVARVYIADMIDMTYDSDEPEHYEVVTHEIIDEEWDIETVPASPAGAAAPAEDDFGHALAPLIEGQLDDVIDQEVAAINVGARDWMAIEEALTRPVRVDSPLPPILTASPPVHLERALDLFGPRTGPARPVMEDDEEGTAPTQIVPEEPWEFARNGFDESKEEEEVPSSQPEADYRCHETLDPDEEEALEAAMEEHERKKNFLDSYDMDSYW